MNIIEMAREAGIHVYPEFENAFEHFAALVAAQEREECAKVCDELHRDWKWRAAEAIRARGEQHERTN